MTLLRPVPHGTRTGQLQLQKQVERLLPFVPESERAMVLASTQTVARLTDLPPRIRALLRTAKRDQKRASV